MHEINSSLDHGPFGLDQAKLAVVLAVAWLKGRTKSRLERDYDSFLGDMTISDYTDA